MARYSCVLLGCIVSAAGVWACGDDGASAPRDSSEAEGVEDVSHEDVSLETGDTHTAGSVIGHVSAGGAPVANARVTLFREGWFDETRSDDRGDFALAGVPGGAYELGVAALDLAYEERAVNVAATPLTEDFALLPETEPGAWTIVGDTLPEEFGGTNSGVITRSATIVACHDTVNPLFFDPLAADLEASKYICPYDLEPERCQHDANDQPLEPPDVRVQGCHNLAHLADGRILYVGGGTIDPAGNFTPDQRALAVVKILDPTTRTWALAPFFLNEPRWYPGLARLADGDLLAFGGGQQDGTPATLGSRTATAEVMERATMRWTYTANDLSKPGGFGPATLLFDGRVFITWYPPQMFDPITRRFSAAPDFLQPARSTPADGHDGCSVDTPDNQAGEPGIADHPDHSTVVHTDGRVVAIGIWGRALRHDGGSMVEIFDPQSNAWRLGAGSPAVIRAHPEVVQLPDTRILVAAGKYEGGAPKPPGTNEWCYTPVADLYDVTRDRFRGVAPMNKAREYHAITMLLPDARVISIAGTAQPGLNPSEAQSAGNIEIYTPPYLRRGVRPRIDAIAATELARGATIRLTVSGTKRATAVRLIGLSAVTHFLDAGVPRLLDLAATQVGSEVTAVLPSDPNRAMAGFYILFVMVDDIPSLGRIVQIIAPG